jgi:nicotinate-nucleotide adenylyltransferase
MTSVTRIGILGGTFDPVHTGHVDTALAAHRALALDRVLVMPSGTPPHRASPPAASRFHRFAMAALAVTGLPALMVSDLEIGHTGPCYTYDTLARVHATGLGAAQIFFITGADAFAEIATWSRYPEVLEMAHFAVVSRPGHPATALPGRLPELAARMVQPAAPASTPDDESAQAGNVADKRLKILLVDAPTPDVSSTEVRRRLAAGESIVGLVPPDVETYIDQHGLYSRGDVIAKFGKSFA